MKHHTLHSHRAWAGTPRVESTVPRPGWWLSVIQLILAYEWLVSSLNKLFDSHFDAGLLGVLQGSTQGNPYTWYATILQRIVIPNHTLFAFLTPWGELAIGLTLATGAAFTSLRLSPRATTYGAGAVCAALLGSAFLSLNYFFQGGTALPWINTSNAFTEGVDIDILIPLISVALLAAYLQLLVTARSTALSFSSAPNPVPERRSGFTLLRQGPRMTLKALLGERVNASETWVDAQGVYWTAEELLAKSPVDLLAQRVTCSGMSVDEEGHGHLQDVIGFDELSQRESASPSFGLIRLQYRHGVVGPVMFVVAGENLDPRTGVLALAGPVGEFLDLRQSTPSDVPAWPLPDETHAAFLAGDRIERPESA